jgi:hypothetical protein
MLVDCLHGSSFLLPYLHLQSVGGKPRDWRLHSPSTSVKISSPLERVGRQARHWKRDSFTTFRALWYKYSPESKQ